MDLSAQISETAGLVGPTYSALDLSDAAGLLLDASYEGEAWQLIPLALELNEVDEFVGRDGEQRELGTPELDPASEARLSCDALNDALRAAEDGWVRVEDYWLALARTMHAHLGLPVLVAEIEMPIPEQVRRQRGSTSTADEFAGLNVILSARIDEHRVAGLFLQDDMIFGSAHLPDVSDAWLIEVATTEIGRSPQVLAGALPRGAVTAEVRDRKGTWHTAVTIPGLWLCVLPQRSGQTDPEVRFCDLVGNAPPHHDDDFSAGVPREDPPESVWAQASRVLSGAQVPALWPAQVAGRPDVYGWDGPADGATAIGLAGGGHRVWIARTATDPHHAFEQHLLRDWRYGAETAAKRAQQIPVTKLAGAVQGKPSMLELVAPQEPWIRDEGWVAVARADRYAVTVTGYDEPPKRLDLEALR